MRNDFLLSKLWIVIMMLGLLVTSCTANAPAVVTPEATVAPELTTNEMRLLNYDTYIDPEILDNFEAQYGVTIQYDTFETQDDMYEIILSGETAYDLVVVTDYYVPLLKSESLLAPLNKDNIPNFDNLDPDFVNTSFDPGSHYCAPYQWGTIGIGYNSAKIRTAPKSWEALFDERYAGRVALLDDDRAMMGTILLLLGYSPNTTDPAEIAEMEQYFLSHSEQIQSIAADNGQDLLASGEVDMVVEYSGDILQIQEENQSFQYIVPQEGTLLWVDSICIPSSTRNQPLAEAFINYLLDPQVGAALSNYIHYATPNQEALPFINEVDQLNPALYPEEDLQRQLFLIVDVGESANALYQEAWSKIVAGVGQ